MAPIYREPQAMLAVLATRSGGGYPPRTISISMVAPLT